MTVGVRRAAASLMTPLLSEGGSLIALSEPPSIPPFFVVLGLFEPASSAIRSGASVASRSEHFNAI